MYFANPWGLLGLLAIPLILFIHLFQRQFPRLEVAGLHLWLSEDQVKTSGLRRDRLPITRTLILELIIATLLTLLLARPLFSNLSSTTHWVFVLDNSASMMAAPVASPSFRDRALDEIEKRVEATGRNTRVTLILTGPRPTMLAGPAVRWQDAKQTFVDWQPQKTRHQFQSAWDMASQLADSSGKPVFITDRRTEHPGFPPKMELVSVGASLSNLAFETARWSIDTETLEASLYLRVRNYSDTSVKADVVGQVDGQEIFRQTTQLAAGASLPLATGLPGGIKSLDLTIESPQDRLATDSRLRLIEPGLRTIKYVLLLESEHPGADSIRRFLGSTTNVQRASNIEDADFVISPFLPSGVDDLSEDVWQLSVGPVEMSEEARNAATSTSGPFLLDRRNPLLEGLSLQGIIWAGHQGIETPLTPLISVGKKVLLGERVDTACRAFVLDIDFARSNVAESPNFPILLNNLIEGCRAAKPGLRRWNYHLNELVRFELDPLELDLANPEPLQLVHESGSRSLPRLKSVEVPPLTRTGEYELKDGDRLLGRFAANFFDAQESDLTRLSGGTDAARESGDTGFLITEVSPWAWMILISLSITLAIWNWAGLRATTRKVVVP